jgi:hypothetical protein
LQYPDKLVKLVYCSRTVPEIEKTVGELSRLIEFYKRETKQPELKFLGDFFKFRLVFSHTSLTWDFGFDIG